MTFLGSIGFTTPWFLAALASLPVLWYLLRISPPQPRRIPFPPLRILRALTQREETPARTPPWLLLLRLLIATLVILALSGPVLNPESRLAGNGPVVLVVDDGWAAAPDWSTRIRALDSLIERAERSQRPVVLLGTALRAGTPEPISLHSPAEARRMLRALRPLPWNTDRAALARRIAGARLPAGADVFWICDGLKDDGAAPLGKALRRLGGVHAMVAPATVLGLTRPAGDRRVLTARVVRPAAGAPRGVEVLAATRKGLVLGRAVARFGATDRTALATFDLPAEARNQVARLSLARGESAGGVVLLDETSAWRVVGLVAEGDLEQEQPLLSSDFYLDRALSPFADVAKGDLESLLQRRLSVLVLADVGRVVPAEAGRIAAWVRNGGVLVRFAGPRLAKAQADDGGPDQLLPVRLRQGDRALGGALSWERPAHLAPFDQGGPFAGLTIPPDVAVKRQVLAEPGPELGERTWARLTDGTPLVTGMRAGDGWIVLFHVTANVDWSNLPMSGLFVEMLRRLVDLGHGVAGGSGNPAAARTLLPRATLDGFGRLTTPPPEALPVNEAKLADTAVGPLHPPGFYAASGAQGGRALNLLAPTAELAPIGPLPTGLQRIGFEAPRETELARWLLAAAVLLGVLDGLIVLGLRGQLPAARRIGRGAGAAMMALGIGMAAAWPAPAHAQDAPPSVSAGAANSAGRSGNPIAAKSVDAALHTRLAYVRTGDPGVDAMSRAGLIGLSRVLRERTAFEPAEPFPIDPETDDLVFYPVIYWPMTAAQKPLSDAALAKISAYMRHGGMILFDTRERQAGYDDTGGGTGEGAQVLRNVLSRLDVPPLVPVPENHVLTKSFYLLQSFPGRYVGGRVWVEAPGADSLYDGAASDRDGVSSIVIGGNDWASAWAVDDSGQPIADIGSDDMRQREMAYRFGVNLVMYALTGNYKADQVHVPALLERLGQ